MASDLVNATITDPSSFENGDFHKNHRITNWPLTRHHATDHHSLGLAIQIVFKPHLIQPTQ